MDNSKWTLQSCLWIFLCICGGLVLVYNLLEIQQYPVKSTYFSEPRPKTVFTEEMHLKGFLVRTPGCTIPDMKAMDTSIKKFIFNEKKVICNDGVPALVGSNLTSVYIIESSLEHYKVNDTDLLKCCFQPFNRANPKNNEHDKGVEFDKNCYTFNNSANVSYEFIKVKCIYNDKEIYKDFFDFVPLKNTSLEIKRNNKKQLNVLIIGIDAVSRLNLHRQMPKTVKYLSNLKAIEMLGYNKVGDNTFPNVIPILTGLSEDQLKEKCWPKQDSYFDKCPFLWENYKNVGYTTAFGEDSAWMGLFYYTRNGFKKQPTDYFWDQFDIAAEKQIGNKHRLNVDQCIGARAVYKVFLDYISKFVKTMNTNSKPFFGFFWGSSLSHDFLNKPKLGDIDYYNFLFDFNKTGLLNNTALIILSDHGIRWGDIRSTYQGRMEERLPFLYIGLPDWYAQEHSELVSNLKTNKRRLTTPFDLHEMLLDLVNPENLTNEFIAKRSSNQTMKRGYSLFDKITVNRTCDDAGISSHWCTCQTSKKIDVDDNIVKEAANYTVHEHINELLIGYADCAQLEVDEILDARIQVNSDDMQKAHFSEDYTITFKTKPSGAIFETTVRKFTSPKDYYFNVTGTVSRINLYGKQSLCITDFHLKLYCYCKQYLSSH